MGSAGLPYPDPTDAVTVLSAPTVLEECRACAAVLQKKAMEGMRFRDMAICCGDENVYSAMLTPMFASLGIPLYRSEKRQVLAHPVARFVLLALEGATEGMEPEPGSGGSAGKLLRGMGHSGKSLFLGMDDAS